MTSIPLILTIFISTSNRFYCSGSDITTAVFGSLRDTLPAAFGDFNSDELTDVFVTRPARNVYKTVEVLLAADEEPLLRSKNIKCHFDDVITSVVPGDFDGDALMDVLVTTKIDRDTNDVWILWGGLNHLNCTETPIIKRIKGQPVVIDYNQDMIVDLFGEDEFGERCFWLFNTTRGAVEKKRMEGYETGNSIRNPHANAYLDLDDDHTSDLFVTGVDALETWRGRDSTFEPGIRTQIPPQKFLHVGQSLFLDMELNGRLELITPVCFDKYCTGSALYTVNYTSSSLSSSEAWHDLLVSFRDNSGNEWHWPVPEPDRLYAEAITLRQGDYNMDGYPDLLATLVSGEKKNAFLLENVLCEGSCGGSNGTIKRKRTFRVRWEEPLTTGSVIAAAFYDFYQDGVLDAMVIYENNTVAAIRNDRLDYDANFVKVMVVTGLTNAKSPSVIGRLGKRNRRTYGSNLPGPSVSYRTTTQEGDERHGVSAQLPQSAHHALGLPYTIFGLGRTPNFVDGLGVGLFGQHRDWTQIIPNSQVVVVPKPLNDPTKWRAQLFVTPSKLILMSVAALTSVCGLITVIIAVLYWRERQEDRKERLQESHRFHFDAM